eukprot:Seg469.3 transcript_id=Seg469.3/GoldUCD/mRNA.D3Y31 product="putative protein C7orf57-like" protein_id=Seg469.3/GoldUCD/D3Y31
MAHGEFDEEKQQEGRRNPNTSVVTNRVSGQDWFYHAPRTEQNKSKKPTEMAAVSQIPGIGDLDNSPVDLAEDVHLRRKWIRDTDSSYTKLAKAGGRKDLFIYRNHKPSSKGAVAYPRVDWFDHDNIDAVQNQPNEDSNSGTTYKCAYPDWYVHDDTDPVEAVVPKQKRQILGFDDMSHWKREEVEGEQNRVKSTPVKLPSLGKSKHSHSKMKHMVKTHSNDFKFPEIHRKTVKKQDANIGQLLSMQYQRDWLKEQDDSKQVSEQKKAQNLERERQKYERDQKYVERLKDSNPQTQEDSHPFKLSRFTNVAAKTDSHRT